MAFREKHDVFEKRGVVVIGISKDSEASHAKFVEKQKLPFLLLSDPERQAIDAFGVWTEKKLYGKLGFGVIRSTFVIDEQGVIEKVFPKANPSSNAEDILAYLE